MPHPIVLEVHKSPKLTENLIGIVRITPEAENTLRALVRATGLPMRTVASQIILQAADLVEIREVT